jgi:hypothetical protein
MVLRALIFLHRWLGVTLCVLFLLWFPSGIGMMYWTYPTVTAADRLERSSALDPTSVVVPPAEAAATLNLDRPGAVRLNTFDGRPVYRFGGGRGGDALVVYADTGEVQGEISRLTTPRVASAWTGQPVDQATVESVDDVDQWTLQASVRTLRPLWKYSWPNGEQVYVSEATGEVVQYTTTASRLGAYVSAIPHWFYFTPLRKHGPEWSAIVIWTSGIGTVAAIVGILVGVWLYSPKKTYRYAGAPSSIPYRGQKRWHTVFGLIFGVATVTYAFSGMLSMDPFPSWTGGGAGPRRDGPSIAQALRGPLRFSAFEAKHPKEALTQLAGLQVKELELTSFAGEPIYVATLAGGDTRVVPVRGEPMRELDRARIVEVVTRAAEGRVETRLLEQYDRYYLDRDRERPLPVILAQLTDGDGARYYIDPKTARVVGSYSSRQWVSRWLYNGLHSLDFPWLYNYRPLWDIVVITLMLGGTALCVTSLVLAWRVLGRRLARAFSRVADGEGQLREDVA